MKQRNITQRSIIRVKHNVLIGNPSKTQNFLLTTVSPKNHVYKHSWKCSVQDIELKFEWHPRDLSNIYDGVFLQKQITAKSRSLFSEKASCQICDKILNTSLCSIYQRECIWVQYTLPLSGRKSLTCRNQSIDLLCKSMGRFLYDKDLRHERVK